MKPSDRIEYYARKRLDKERKKGMYLFPVEVHHEALLEAIIDYLDENYERKTKISLPKMQKRKLTR